MIKDRLRLLSGNEPLVLDPTDGLETLGEATEQYSFWMLTRYQNVKALLRAPRQCSSATGIEIDKRPHD